MKTPVFCMIALAGFATLATAQTKISGTGKCGKPDMEQAAEVGDRAGPRDVSGEDVLHLDSAARDGRDEE